MILGAGIYQVPLIKAAKKMGIYTLVASIPGNYPGFEYADKVYYENTIDYDAILKIAKEEKIDGIVTAGTDVAVITIGKVCDELGLSGLSFEAAQIAANKLLMKTKYEEYGVRTARFRQVSLDCSDIIKEIDSLNFPLIFKSVDSSGSRGIVRVDSVDEFDTALNEVKCNTRSDYFIIEEFIEGEEFGAQAFVYNDEIKFIIPHGDYVFQGNTGVPIGHFAPYDLDSTIVDDTKTQLNKAIKAMGLNNCAINADFILKDNQVYVLEIGGRSGATCLAELVSIYYGFDYYEKIILAALGENPEFECSKYAVPNASMLLTSDQDGVITLQVDNNVESPNIVDVQFDYSENTHVNKFQVGPHRIGHVITKGASLEEAVDTLNNALSNIVIKVS